MNKLVTYLLFMTINVCLVTFLHAQEDLKKLKHLFPESIESFKTDMEPEIARVKANGVDYYHLVQRYFIDIDTSFTVRIHDYQKEPEFIDRMLKEFKNSPPYEDESEKWSDLKILGYPTKLQIVKKYPTYNFTTLVKEKSWFITFSGNGMGENEAKEYMTIFLYDLFNN